MSTEQASEVVEAVLAELVSTGVITSERYGRMTVEQMDKLAQVVKNASEE